MSRDQIISQAMGVSLAATTAIGCIAYERLVSVYPYFIVGIIISLHYAPFWLASGIFQTRSWPPLKEHFLEISVMGFSGVSGPIWYYITRKQGLLISAGYEIKYVVILGLFYAFAGERKITASTVLGISFAILSVVCFSKNQK